jgi:hypothetical protein
MNKKKKEKEMERNVKEEYTPQERVVGSGQMAQKPQFVCLKGNL